MDCSNCKKAYNEGEHAPRLLTQCGHSICEKCTKDLFKDSRITCPECKTNNYASNPSLFPKNLALLNLKGAPQPSASKARVTSSLNDSVITDALKDPLLLCPRHKKKIEGLLKHVLRKKYLMQSLFLSLLAF
jgi:hypothetical protein